MDNFSREILVLSKKILAELRRPSAVFLRIQEQSEAVAKDHQPKGEREQAPPILRAELQIPQSIKSDWERENTQKNRRDRFAIGVSVVTLFALIAYATLVYFQWREMISSTDAAFDAANQAGRGAAAAKQASGTAAQALKDSEDSFAKTLEQMKRQTTAQQKAAVATEKSNETAMASLHISERAYISMNPPQMDTAQHPIAISFPLVNGGHIPSGNIEVVCHQATFESNAPMLSWNPGLSIDRSWKRFRFPPSPPGSPFAIYIALESASKEKLQSGLQAILVAGKITYRDGFPDDPIQEWPFCTQTTYAVVTKKMVLSPCDGSEVVPFLEHLDGYPNNESRD